LKPDARPQIYTPLPQFYEAFPWQFSLSILLRAKTLPNTAVSALNAAVRDLDPSLALFNVETPRELLAEAYSREQFLARILAVFGLLAFVLAVAGLYGVLAYITAKRTKEFASAWRLALRHAKFFVLVLMQGGGSHRSVLAWSPRSGSHNTASKKPALRRFADGFSHLPCRRPALPWSSFSRLLPARARATSVDPMLALRDE